MALVNPTTTKLSADPEVIVVSWALTTADHTGVAVSFPQHADTCWHAIGTWGGATAAVQGSNRDVDGEYGAISNASGGAAITWTADGAPKQAIERPMMMRPKLTTAGTAAAVTVTAVLRKMPRYK